MDNCVKKFNFYVNEFLEQIIELTDDNDLEVYNSLLQQYLKIYKNRNVPIEIFCKEIILSEKDKQGLTFADYIKNKDEEKFLSIDITGENNKHGGNEISLKKLFEYKKLWMTLDNENKNIMFDYFNKLVNLAEKYLELNYS